MCQTALPASDRTENPPPKPPPPGPKQPLSQSPSPIDQKMPPLLPKSTLLRNRLFGFLIWQSIVSSLLFFLSETLISSLPTINTAAAATATAATSSSAVLSFVLCFLVFHLSQLLFSTSFAFLSSPQPAWPAAPWELLLGLFGVVVGKPRDTEWRERVSMSVGIGIFVVACAVSGFLGIVAVGWCFGYWDFAWRVVGFRGFVVGLVYGVMDVLQRRWMLRFPIVQRTLFFSFKMGLPSSLRHALELSAAAYVFSALLAAFIPGQFSFQSSLVKFLNEQIVFSIAVSAVFLCWELNHHLHQALHTKRFIFAPPRGSAAAETNPSEPLLAALEESSPGLLTQYLAYLDLCMVSENNVDTWRRAAFFEETGDTYNRAIALCLKPLEKLAMTSGECLETPAASKTFQLSKQLLSPTELQVDPYCYELLDNYQLYSWCARIVASLTARSRTEDRYGVAQLTGCNAAVVSTLLSCLLAMESFMGKKTQLPSPNQLIGAGGIRWAMPNSGPGDTLSGVMVKRRKAPLRAKAYSVSDVLRTSVYQIVSAFYDEMLAGVKSGTLDRDWISSAKPPFGTRDLLSEKLRLFLDFRVS